MSSDKDGNNKKFTEEGEEIKCNIEIMKNNSTENEDPQNYTEEKSNRPIENLEKITVATLSNLIDNISLGGDSSNKQSEPETEKQDRDKEIKNTVIIPDWLKDCETPFSWDLEQERGLGSEHVILRTLEKLDDLLIEEPEFSLQRYVSLLKLVLEYYIIGNITKCCENMKIIEGCLEEEISRGDEIYQKVKISLGHVVSATKAHVLYIIGKEEESKKIGRCIIPTKIMSDADRAAINSMKARFFLYSGYENGEEVGVNYIRKALELEPDNAEWEYLLAKMLRQQRREVPFSSEVPRDELKLLESAVARDKNPKYLVYLAQVYRECSHQAFKQYKNHPNFYGELQSSIEMMAAKALEYYKEALSMSPDSPAVLRRVGYGIMNLPKKFADYDLALKCLNQSLEISENQMTLHVLGTFYHRYRNDNKKALEYFEKTARAGSHFGLFDMVRVKWLVNPNYDPIPDFEVGLSWKIKKKYHHQLLTQIGGYYLFVKRDFYKALEYFKEVIVEDKDSPLMKTFKSYFLSQREPIDLMKILANEALLLVQKNDSSSTLEPETSDEEEAAKGIDPTNLGHVEDFLDLISEVRPELMEITPDPELIPKLIKACKVGQSSWNRYSNQGRDNFRGRGGGFSGGTRNRGRNYSGNTGGRQRSQDRNERRGRFSSGNQREQEPEGERRGGSHRGRGRNENWRNKPRNDEDNKTGGRENWRRK